MLDKPKSKGLSVLIGIGRKKAGVSGDGGGADAGGDEPSDALDKGRVACDELADCLQVADKDAFYRCFKNAVSAVDDDQAVSEPESEPAAV